MAARPPGVNGSNWPGGSTSPANEPGSTTWRTLAPLTSMLRELGDFDPADLRRWLQLLGFTRPPSTPASASARNDLGALLQRTLGPAIDAARSPSTPEPGGRENLAGDEFTHADSRPPASLREGLRLAEQVLGQNLLQRVSAGLQTEAQQSPVLNLALPFLDGQQVRSLAIEVEQRGRREATEDTRWEVRLRFELSGLGPVCCLLSLQGARVGAQFFSREDATRVAIEAALPELRRQLDRAGFVADELLSRHGEVPPEAANNDRLPVDSVIDLRA